MGVTTEQRAPNLDALRAVAALMVLFGHAYALGGRQLPGLVAEGDAWSVPWLRDIALGTLPSGVAFFFVLSGYLISRPFIRSLTSDVPAPNRLGYALRRAARIYPLYWAAFAVTVLALGTAATDAKNALAHVLLLHNFVPGRERAGLDASWTLSLEVVFYAFVPLAAAAVARTHRGPVRLRTLAKVIAAMWVASVGWALAAASVDSATYQSWLLTLFPAALSAFCPGMLLAVAELHPGWQRARRRLAADGRLRWAMLGIGVGGLAVSALVSLGLRPAGGRVTDGYLAQALLARQGFTVFYGSLVAYALLVAPWQRRLGRAMAEIGAISYGVYLIHAVTLHVLRTPQGRHFVPLAHGGAAAYLVHVALVLAVTVPAAWLSWHRLERPVLERVARYADEVGARRPGAAPELGPAAA